MDVERIAEELGLTVEQVAGVIASAAPVLDGGTVESRSMFSAEELAESRRRRGLA